ncbi:MAG: Rv2175c family DNA-binding protein [Actinomycetota bacterium]
MANDSNPDEPADDDLEELVGEWLTVPDIGERMGLRLSDVRQMIEDRQVLAVRIGPRKVVSVPSKFFNEEGPLPELPGTFTVLRDSRMTDAQILRWLFTPDDSLPVQGAPMDALLAGFKTEVRRRAMEAAY